MRHAWTTVSVTLQTASVEVAYVCACLSSIAKTTDAVSYSFLVLLCEILTNYGNDIFSLDYCTLLIKFKSDTRS